MWRLDTSKKENIKKTKGKKCPLNCSPLLRSCCTSCFVFLFFKLVLCFVFLNFVLFCVFSTAHLCWGQVVHPLCWHWTCSASTGRARPQISVAKDNTNTHHSFSFLDNTSTLKKCDVRFSVGRQSHVGSWDCPWILLWTPRTSWSTSRSRTTTTSSAAPCGAGGGGGRIGRYSLVAMKSPLCKKYYVTSRSPSPIRTSPKKIILNLLYLEVHWDSLVKAAGPKEKSSFFLVWDSFNLLSLLKLKLQKNLFLSLFSLAWPARGAQLLRFLLCLCLSLSAATLSLSQPPVVFRVGR